MITYLWATVCYATELHQNYGCCLFQYVAENYTVFCIEEHIKQELLKIDHKLEDLEEPHADDCAMQISHLRNRFKTASETARNFRVPLSRQTVSRRLSALGLKSIRPVKRAYLTARHRQARFNWARIHRQWTLRMWQDVIFSNESRYFLAKHDGRLRVYRRPGDRFQNCTVNEASDRRSVMVWGAISTTESKSASYN